MTNEQIFNWIKENKLKPEKAAAIFDISLSTLNIARRGAPFTDEMREKITQAIKKYSAPTATVRKAS